MSAAPLGPSFDPTSAQPAGAPPGSQPGENPASTQSNAEQDSDIGLIGAPDVSGEQREQPAPKGSDFRTRHPMGSENSVIKPQTSIQQAEQAAKNLGEGATPEQQAQAMVKAGGRDFIRAVDAERGIPSMSALDPQVSMKIEQGINQSKIDGIMPLLKAYLGSSVHVEKSYMHKDPDGSEFLVLKPQGWSDDDAIAMNRELNSKWTRLSHEMGAFLAGGKVAEAQLGPIASLLPQGPLERAAAWDALSKSENRWWTRPLLGLPDIMQSVAPESAASYFADTGKNLNVPFFGNFNAEDLWAFGTLSLPGSPMGAVLGGVNRAATGAVNKVLGKFSPSVVKYLGEKGVDQELLTSSRFRDPLRKAQNVLGWFGMRAEADGFTISKKLWDNPKVREQVSRTLQELSSQISEAGGPSGLFKVYAKDVSIPQHLIRQAPGVLGQYASEYLGAGATGAAFGATNSVTQALLNGQKISDIDPAELAKQSLEEGLLFAGFHGANKAFNAAPGFAGKLINGALEQRGEVSQALEHYAQGRANADQQQAQRWGMGVQGPAQSYVAPGRSAPLPVLLAPEPTKQRIWGTSPETAQDPHTGLDRQVHEMQAKVEALHNQQSTQTPDETQQGLFSSDPNRKLSSASQLALGRPVYIGDIRANNLGALFDTDIVSAPVYQGPDGRAYIVPTTGGDGAPIDITGIGGLAKLNLPADANPTFEPAFSSPVQWKVWGDPSVGEYLMPDAAATMAPDGLESQRLHLNKYRPLRDPADSPHDLLDATLRWPALSQERMDQYTGRLADLKQKFNERWRTSLDDMAEEASKDNPEDWLKNRVELTRAKLHEQTLLETAEVMINRDRTRLERDLLAKGEGPEQGGSAEPPAQLSPEEQIYKEIGQSLDGTMMGRELPEGVRGMAEGLSTEPASPNPEEVPASAPPREIKRGMQAVLNRLERELSHNNAGDLTPDQLSAIHDFMQNIGPEMFDQVALRIARRSPHRQMANYDYLSSTVRLFREQLAKHNATGHGSEDGWESALLHELTHHIDRYLPDDIRASIQKEYEKAYSRVEKKAPWLRELLSAAFGPKAPEQDLLKRLSEDPTFQKNRLGLSIVPHPLDPTRLALSCEPGSSDFLYSLTDPAEWLAVHGSTAAKDALHDVPADSWTAKVGGHLGWLWTRFVDGIRRYTGAQTASSTMRDLMTGKLQIEKPTGPKQIFMDGQIITLNQANRLRGSQDLPDETKPTNIAEGIQAPIDEKRLKALEIAQNGGSFSRKGNQELFKLLTPEEQLNAYTMRLSGLLLDHIHQGENLDLRAVSKHMQHVQVKIDPDGTVTGPSYMKGMKLTAEQASQYSRVWEEANNKFKAQSQAYELFDKISKLPQNEKVDPTTPLPLDNFLAILDFFSENPEALDKLNPNQLAMVFKTNNPRTANELLTTTMNAIQEPAKLSPEDQSKLAQKTPQLEEMAERLHRALLDQARPDLSSPMSQDDAQLASSGQPPIVGWGWRFMDKILSGAQKAAEVMSSFSTPDIMLSRPDKVLGWRAIAPNAPEYVKAVRTGDSEKNLYKLLTGDESSGSLGFKLWMQSSYYRLRPYMAAIQANPEFGKAVVSALDGHIEISKQKSMLFEPSTLVANLLQLKPGEKISVYQAKQAFSEFFTDTFKRVAKSKQITEPSEAARHWSNAEVLRGRLLNQLAENWSAYSNKLDLENAKTGSTAALQGQPPPPPRLAQVPQELFNQDPQQLLQWMKTPEAKAFFKEVGIKAEMTNALTTTLEHGSEAMKQHQVWKTVEDILEGRKTWDLATKLHLPIKKNYSPHLDPYKALLGLYRDELISEGSRGYSVTRQDPRFFNECLKERTLDQAPNAALHEILSVYIPMMGKTIFMEPAYVKAEPLVAQLPPREKEYARRWMDSLRGRRDPSEESFRQQSISAVMNDISKTREEKLKALQEAITRRSTASNTMQYLNAMTFMGAVSPANVGWYHLAENLYIPMMLGPGSGNGLSGSVMLNLPTYMWRNFKGLGQMANEVGKGFGDSLNRRLGAHFGGYSDASPSYLIRAGAKAQDMAMSEMRDMYDQYSGREKDPMALQALRNLWKYSYTWPRMVSLFNRQTGYENFYSDGLKHSMRTLDIAQDPNTNKWYVKDEVTGRAKTGHFDARHQAVEARNGIAEKEARFWGHYMTQLTFSDYSRANQSPYTQGTYSPLWFQFKRWGMNKLDMVSEWARQASYLQQKGHLEMSEGKLPDSFKSRLFQLLDKHWNLNDAAHGKMTDPNTFLRQQANAAVNRSGEDFFQNPDAEVQNSELLQQPPSQWPPEAQQALLDHLSQVNGYYHAKPTDAAIRSSRARMGSFMGYTTGMAALSQLWPGLAHLIPMFSLTTANMGLINDLSTQLISLRNEMTAGLHSPQEVAALDAAARNFFTAVVPMGWAARQVWKEDADRAAFIGGEAGQILREQQKRAMDGPMGTALGTMKGVGRALSPFNETPEHLPGISRLFLAPGVYTGAKGLLHGRIADPAEWHIPKNPPSDAALLKRAMTVGPHASPMKKAYNWIKDRTLLGDQPQPEPEPEGPTP